MKNPSVLVRSALRWLFAALAVGLLFGCAQNKYPPAPVSASTADYTYIVGPGDNINIIVWRNPEISMSVPIRPDGKFSTPLVDELVAQGKTPVQIAREIEKQLEKYVRDPVVTVVVGSFQGVYSEQIRIVGEAARPQSVAFRQNMSLLDVMIQSGGLTDFADGNAAVLVRGAEGGKQYSIRLKDLLKRGDISANVDVKPGDIIIVPQSWF